MKLEDPNANIINKITVEKKKCYSDVLGNTYHMFGSLNFDEWTK